MDFIKGNEKVKIDPNSIQIQGDGNIVIDSEKITGDFSLNGKVTIIENFDVIGDTSLNCKVSINDNLDINNKTTINADTSLNGNMSISNNLDIQGESTFNNKITINNNQDINSDLRINGNIEISGNEKIFVTNEGLVGIGTNNPQTYSQSDSALLTINKRDTLNTQSGIKKLIRLNSTKINADWYDIQTNDDINNSRIEFKNYYNDELGVQKSHNIMCFKNGNIGIGSSEPNFPIEIVSNKPLQQQQYLYYYHTGSGLHDFYQNSNVHSGGYISLKAHGSLWTTRYLLSSSDSRIKTDISLVSDNTALEQVKQLETYCYNYIDPIIKRDKKTIGFLAQDVEKVIPNAINIQRNWIPDEMRKIENPKWTKDNNKIYLHLPNLDLSGNFTGNGKFFVSNDISGNDEICKEVKIKKIPDESRESFTITEYVAEFDQSWKNVFFYGKEVNDFQTIDKSQIFALHHSAIQELDRKHENEIIKKNNKINLLKDGITNLTNQINNLISKMETLEEALQNK